MSGILGISSNCLVIFMMSVAFADALPPIIKIAAIFEKELADSAMEHVFRYTVNKINNDKSILPVTTLVHDIQYVSRNDSFHTGKTVCSQLNAGAQAIFGPTDSILATHVQSICDALDIPHLEWRLDYGNNGRKEFSVNLYPSQSLMNVAMRDLINYLNWTKVAVIYEQNHGLTKLRELMRVPGLEVFVRQVEPHSYQSVLNEIKEKEYYNLIVDTNPDYMNEFLKGILQLQMNEYKYHYFFTSFDIETFDVEDFKYNFVNITAFRLVDLSDIGVKELVKDMERYYHTQGISIFDTNHYIKTKSALIYDSVYVFAIALQALEQSHKLRISNVSCTAETPWNGGLSLVNYINGVEWKGLTGPIEFKEGRRVKFKLDLIKLKQHAVVSVGEWLPESGLNITDSTSFYETSTMNVTLVVITILETPYVMMHYGKNYTGNARFFGFCVDILDKIAKQVGFEYILDLVPDRKYGAKDPITGEWNGMVAQLMKHKADLAVGSMTINYARESVIDFTKPFMNLGISILFKVPAAAPSRLFSFMKPLAIDIWMYVFIAYILVSITVYIVAHFSPNEWHNPHPCETENNIVENQFSMSNSFWFTIGTLMQQGSDLNPKANSTRIVSGIWWFFTLIMISSYTANLAAFLTVERMITPIENSEDLAAQTEISYGTLDSGSTMTFFQDSLIETYKKMWRFMENRKPKVFTSTYEEGIRRVLEGNYAFLMESTMLDYVVQRNCNLTQIGGLLDSKGYGIATPMGSPWRDKISLSILEMQEKGEIQMLYDKWWKKKGDTCERDDKNKNSKANALGVDNIGGVFVVLLCGLAFAVTIAILEFCQKSSKAAYDDPLAVVNQRQSLCSEMTEELCFALRGPSTQKRPALKRQCSKCLENNTNYAAKQADNTNKLSYRRNSKMVAIQ